MWLQTLRAPDADGIRLSDIDVGFAQDMSVHHEQALRLTAALTRDCDPVLRGLADRMAVSQSAEIATMRGWLSLTGEPAVGAEQMRWMHGGAEHEMGASMPGMASTDDIAALADARGTDAEIRFLQLMIRHHRGGIEMARAAVAGVDIEPIRNVARGMVADQGNEIGVMLAMLAVRGAQPLTYP
ncbi:DUF305 domain-containing protein [Skermania piniformis]|uniref:DUF305 domain-containing protein n=2 Tax=Skermania pinensis TaxID=39122 RepID=A0ABX8SDH3_9ACTN|nr:DUF305 domain-containing protein [Skermania piniformis]QXQ15963.1 DUF305 domain-containing protein [Skermania piniformis]